MKKTELQEKKNKNEKELVKELADSQIELTKIRLDYITGALKNTGNIKNLRRRIAQLSTLISQKRIEALYQKNQANAV